MIFVVQNPGASLTTWMIFATVMLCDDDNARGSRWSSVEMLAYSLA